MLMLAQIVFAPVFPLVIVDIMLSLLAFRAIVRLRKSQSLHSGKSSMSDPMEQLRHLLSRSTAAFFLSILEIVVVLLLCVRNFVTPFNEYHFIHFSRAMIIYWQVSLILLFILKAIQARLAWYVARKMRYFLMRCTLKLAGVQLDDGFTRPLLPRDYLHFRVRPKLRELSQISSQQSFHSRFIQVTVYFMGGVGTLLAALELDLLIAVSASVAAALTGYLDQTGLEEQVQVAVMTSTQLSNIEVWWVSLSTIVQSNPAKAGQLVREVEGAILHGQSAAFAAVSLNASLNDPTASGDGGGERLDIKALATDLEGAMQGDKLVLTEDIIKKHTALFEAYDALKAESAGAMELEKLHTAENV